VYNPYMSEVLKKKFYTIREVAEIVGVEPYVLRYWEKEFPNLRVHKDKGGRRLYTDEDIEKILKIKHLLREEGYTIEGAKRVLRGKKEERGEVREAEMMALLEEIRRALYRILKIIDEN